MSYEIGYRKPPRHSQFKKGTSGNPKGRPRRDPTNWGMTMEAVLNKLVTVQIDGWRARINGKQAICRQIRNKAITGSIPAIKLAMEMDQMKYDPEADQAMTVQIVRFTDPPAPKIVGNTEPVDSTELSPDAEKPGRDWDDR